MMEYIQEHALQLIEIILVIISLGAMILFYLWQRQKKGFAYELIASTSLLSVAEEHAGKIQITYEDKPVKKVHLFVLKLMNSGRVPILEDDFKRRIEIVFSEDTNILSMGILEEKPDGIEASIGVVDGTLILLPVMLNGGDSITIKCLLDDFDGKYVVNGRIAGVTSFKRYAPRSREQAVIFTFMILSVLTFLISSLTLALTPLYSGISYPEGVSTPLLSLVIVSAALSAFYIILWRKFYAIHV